MQYKSLAAVLFASMAMAAPADVESESQAAEIDDLIPPSIATVLATAVPTSFWAEATNTANFLSQVEQGMVSNSWPTWYSSLPDSVKEYVTTAVEGYYPSFASSVAAEITASGDSSSSPSATEATSTSASSSDASSSDASSSAASSSDVSSSDASSSASSSPSGSAASTTAEDGAAPTGMAMSLAGAAGVLGLALAL
ncbi:unnamed protein product [Penicillium nalgiovense]|uniref:Uncharacterized protein n=1 Tax=Penicillium nalgiovense TaxID=60175 RepID=A0A1V6YJF8_PENNA|nr:hypothetical protein PENNAL_c0019G08795 [Penicillium nalgiovense]CAG8097061.1 unnamed protein product [Penicillium nalgiovense]CAG8182965.1 unnamed protein product [Penicillium nalgiovense]CAG8188563.1 unnamed protein product [Penicillium nalgiovense]CAG8189611.1 unnamed protein product [Penicillium nalgiovense]